jgi:hypothetical protein
MRFAALLLGTFLFLAMWVGPLVGRAAAPTVDQTALPGVYECQGTGADGRPYRGAVIIEPDGDRFLVQWYIAAELTAVGLGIRDRDVLAVSFFGADSGGVVLYRIDGGRLLGHWSAPMSDGQVFEETLTRKSDVPSRPLSQPPAATPPASPRPPARPFGGTRPI